MRSTASSRQPRREHPALGAMQRGLENLEALQDADGSWPGDYGGPMFLLPMYLALCHAAGPPSRGPRASGRDDRLLLSSVQNAGREHRASRRGPAGQHVHHGALAYVALRVLGLSARRRPARPDARAGSSERHAARRPPRGASSPSACSASTTGAGIHPFLPELWLLPPKCADAPQPPLVPLPAGLPADGLALRHDARQIPEDALVLALRDELYGGRWSTHRLGAAPRQRLCGRLLPPADRGAAGDQQGRSTRWSGSRSRRLRRKALAEVYEHILYEDRVTNYIDIGPVNKVLNAFVHHFEEPGGESFQRVLRGLRPVPVGRSRRHEDAGLQQQQALGHGLRDPGGAGCRGCRRRDRAARGSAGARPRLPARQPDSRGRAGPPSATTDTPPAAAGHSRTAPTAGRSPTARPRGSSARSRCEGRFQPAIPEPLLRDSVKLMLSWQNDDGGWATYERQRGGAWLEALQPLAGLRRHHGGLLVRRVHQRRRCRLWRGRESASAPRRRSSRRSPAASASCGRSSGRTAASRDRGASASPTAPGSA